MKKSLTLGSVLLLFLIIIAIILSFSMQKNSIPKEFEEFEYFFSKMDSQNNLGNFIVTSFDGSGKNDKNKSISFWSNASISNKSADFAGVTPFYDEEGNFSEYLGTRTENGTRYSWSSLDEDFHQKSNFNFSSDTSINHEFIRLGTYEKYIGLNYEGNKLVFWDSGEIKYLDINDVLGLPEKEGTQWTYIPGDGFHANSIDIYQDDIIINSRNLSSVFSVKLFDDKYNILPEDEWDLEWVFASSPLTLWNISNDAENDKPIIKNDDTVIENPDYTPTLNDAWKKKIISPLGYDFEEYSSGIQFENEINNNKKFYGEHSVRVINNLFEKNPSFLNEPYNQNCVYISMFDNHNVDEKLNDQGLDLSYYISSSVYSYHTDQIENVWNKNVDASTSFTKILKINPTNEKQGELPPMSASLLLNHPNDSKTKNKQFSNYQGSSIFYNYENNNYLLTCAPSQYSMVLESFDSIDVRDGSLVNDKLLLEVKLDSEYNEEPYRANFDFKNISNVDIGWNIYYL